MRNPTFIGPDGMPHRAFDGHVSDFARVAAGKTLGKRVVALVGANPPSQVFAEVDLLSIQGEDNDAMQLSINLAPPRVVPTTGLVLPGTQSITGEQDNHEVPANFVWAKPIIRVDWGIGGVNAVVEADFFNGSVLNFQASYLRARVFIETLNQQAVTSPGAYVCGAFVGPSQGGASTARRSVNLGAIAASPAASAVTAIPRFAKWVQPHLFPQLSVQFIRVEFFRDRAATSKTGEFIIFGGGGSAFPTASEWTMLPGDSYYFRVSNSSGSAISNIEMIFELSL